eukprot:scaffold105460_cov35-Prasinocladus_malaysianus.AAC.2
MHLQLDWQAKLCFLINKRAKDSFDSCCHHISRQQMLRYCRADCHIVASKIGGPTWVEQGMLDATLPSRCMIYTYQMNLHQVLARDPTPVYVTFSHADFFIHVHFSDQQTLFSETYCYYLIRGNPTMEKDIKSRRMYDRNSKQ